MRMPPRVPRENRFTFFTSVTHTEQYVHYINNIRSSFVKLHYSEFRKVSPGMSGGLVVGSIQIDFSFSGSAPGDTLPSWPLGTQLDTLCRWEAPGCLRGVAIDACAGWSADTQ